MACTQKIKTEGDKVLMEMNQLDYLKPIEITEGIYWVGFVDNGASLHCNPYIIVDDDEVVLIDGGSRDEFSTVMLKILRVGINPKDIKSLIYHHSDPDLCASLPQFEAIINSNDLKIISDRAEHTFIKYYSSFDSSKSERVSIDELDYEYEFKSGRILKFISTPYAHAPGSFMTYDVKTKTLFSSDIFGSFNKNWSLYTHLHNECENCNPKEICAITKRECTMNGIIKFHQRVMASSKALEYALEQIKSLDTRLIAPQHGSIIEGEFDKEVIIKHLESLENVGFECYTNWRNK